MITYTTLYRLARYLLHNANAKRNNKQMISVWEFLKTYVGTKNTSLPRLTTRTRKLAELAMQCCKHVDRQAVGRASAYYWLGKLDSTTTQAERVAAHLWLAIYGDQKCRGGKEEQQWTLVNS